MGGPKTQSEPITSHPAKPAAAAVTPGSAALVDAHVHYHACFDLQSFFQHAALNVQRAQRDFHLAEGTPGCLMLAEPADASCFEAMRDGDVRPSGAWVFHRSKESTAITARHDDWPDLVLIAGRQIVTRERLEVLALGTLARFEKGQRVERVLGQVLEAGAIAVLPWGVGKWVGTRGRIVERLLRSSLADQFYFGDNGGRPQLSIEPWLLRHARRQGVRVLPGSDPLPLPHEARKAGKYGLVINEGFDLQRPTASIKAALERRDENWRSFGRRERIGRFFVAQATIQCRNRFSWGGT